MYHVPLKSTNMWVNKPYMYPMGCLKKDTLITETHVFLIQLTQGPRPFKMIIIYFHILWKGDEPKKTLPSLKLTVRP